MRRQAKHWLRSRPQLYDLSVRIRRMFGVRTTGYALLNAFSLIHGRPVRFIQIGASDGLRSDPIREFVVRDRWTGVFVEPLPDSFTHLKRNYWYLSRADLIFVNAAIATAATSTMPLWTFDDAYLAELSEEDRMDALRKSSFNPEHVAAYFGANPNTTQLVTKISVPCVTFSDLVEQYSKFPAIDLLITDLEGYEATFIPNIDFHAMRPTAIFYESHNLGQKEALVSHHLTVNGYDIFNLGGDSFAVRADFLATWQNKSVWAARNLARPTANAQEVKTSSQTSQGTRS